LQVVDESIIGREGGRISQSDIYDCLVGNVHQNA